tara:strand:- start:407 stop:595 length:189 start_codon:yes stop_codon:yes gene_type:complete
MIRPKYCIGEWRGVYFIGKRTIFGYYPMKIESLSGSLIQKTFTTSEEARKYLEWYILDKYLN